MGTPRRLPARLAAIAAAAGLAALVAGGPAQAQVSSGDPRRAPDPGGPASRITYTREDTGSFERTDPFAPGGAQAIVGDFAGDLSAEGRLDDIFWYSPGPGGDALWMSRGDRVFLNKPYSISGRYTPLVGWFGDDRDKEDILWYAPGAGADTLWDFNANGTVTQKALTINGSYTPIVGEFSADDGTDIIWYAPGPVGDSWWDFDGRGGRVQRPLTITGRYRPIVGSFAGRGAPTNDRATDILWYAPGTTGDSLWNFTGDGGPITKTGLRIDGTYTPIPGNFTADGFDDIIWYRPGAGPDSFWNFTGPNGQVASSALTMSHTGTPVVGELWEQPQHRTDILFWGAEGREDQFWDYRDTSTPTMGAMVVGGTRTPVLGTFDLVPYAIPGGGSAVGRGLDVLELP